MRYISNDSSGIQGTSIANALIRKGAEVIFVTGKSTYEKPLGAKIINVESAREMYDAVFKNGPYNVAICAAAVSDWYVDNKNSKKIKKSFLKSPQISLKENPDILSDISKSKNRPELVIGFAAETDDLIKNAKSKLNQKGCDIIVANKIDNKSSVFGNLENKVSIISNDKTVHWPKMSKAEIGEKLSDQLQTLQDKVPPFSKDIALNEIKEGIGKENYKDFINISEPIAAASIAQVHKAQIEDNGILKDVAIKVLRPNIKKVFNDEIEALMLLAYIICLLYTSPSPRD